MLPRSCRRTRVALTYACAAVFLLGVDLPMLSSNNGNFGPIVVQGATSACPGDCSRQGSCNAATTHCDCFQGFTGHDCSLRVCPSGIRWLGMVTATDTLHTTVAECSGAGDCDRNTGLCDCTDPYTGNACERLTCPPNQCQGNGKCVSLAEVGAFTDDLNFFNTATYSRWDAEKAWGCICDYGYTGYDCSLRTCPWGDDPLSTSGSATVDSQTYTCAGTSGYFVARIFGFTTEAIAYNANAATVKAALEALPPIQGVTVSFNSGSVVCASSTITTTIQWTHTPGDIPQLVFPINTANIAYASRSVDGTSTREECSGRGLCTRTGDLAGLCICQTGFSSSNAASTNTEGGNGDCSRMSSTPSACPSPSNVVCSGHGYCSTASSGAAGYLTCLCNDDYTGYDCSRRKCPMGKAWWDDPTATDVAHGWTECSNRGNCDRVSGTCSCDPGNTGSACDRAICPYVASTEATIECNGRGRCMNLRTLQSYREVNGEAAPLVYGSDPGSVDTWDADLLQVCLCDSNRYVNNQYSWTGADCSMRTCPRGDDSETSTVNSGYQHKEIQKVTCIATGGTFTLKFRDETTDPIAWNANANGTNTTMAGTGTVTHGSATLATTSNLASFFAAGDVVHLVHNTDSAQIRTYTVSSDSSSTLVMTEPIGLDTGALYGIFKETVSVEGALQALKTIDDVTVSVESGAAICTTDGQSTAREFGCHMMPGCC